MFAEAEHLEEVCRQAVERATVPVRLEVRRYRSETGGCAREVWARPVTGFSDPYLVAHVPEELTHDEAEDIIDDVNAEADWDSEEAQAHA